jgi:hypothetical protein
MEQYDSVIVFILATVFISVYLYLEARPHGSSLIADIKKTFLRFLRIK